MTERPATPLPRLLLRRRLGAAVGVAARLLGWVLRMTAVPLILLLLVAAYGIPGRWVSAWLPEALSGFTCDRVALRPSSGLVVFAPRLTGADGTLFGTAEQVSVGFRLRGKGDGWLGHIASISAKGLIVPYFEWEAAEAPLPDLSGVPIPNLRGIRLTLEDASVVDIRAKTLTGWIRADAEQGTIDFYALKAVLDGESEQAEAQLTLDIHDAKATARISGTLYPYRLNSLYRFLGFPIIGEYSDNFALNAPAWGNCGFTVGFDKHRDLFVFDLDVVSRHGGTYCGIPFDSAEGHIACRGVDSAVTVIDPLTVRRGDRVVASGRLEFDCPNDRFAFRAESDALMPDEVLRIIDMPFTEIIPDIRCLAPPEVSIGGSMPFMTDPTPASVRLEGSVRVQAPVTVDNVPFERLSLNLAMADSLLTLRQIDAGLAGGGSAEGSLSVFIPQTAEYTDLSGAVRLNDVSLRGPVAPYLPAEDLPDITLNGTVSMMMRTDANALSSLNGDFELDAFGERIQRLPLFAGLTDLLADYVPGISSLTDTSRIRAKGTVRDGVVEIPEFHLTGTVLAVEGPVTYNLPADNLEATLLAGVFKEGTVIGSLTRWALVPLARLIMEIEVRGPLFAPEWTRASTLNKLLPFWED